MVEISVKSGEAWVCETASQLSDILVLVQLKNEGEELPDSDISHGPVMLEQRKEGSPCVLTLRSSTDSPAIIGRLMLVSEARTLEVYDQHGEYCGTVRGEADTQVHVKRCEVQTSRSDRGPFYRKQLIIPSPVSSCDIKLLSLGGRSSVLVHQMTVGLLPPPSNPLDRPPGIDLEQVQTMVEEMGASLSPGAQNLLDMIHFQQQNQTSTLGGFLPLMMRGGVLSALTRGGGLPADTNVEQSVQNLRDLATLTHHLPPSQNGVTSPASDSVSPPEEPHSDISAASSGSPSQWSEIMSHFVRGSEGAELLQSICGHVTQLRLGEAQNSVRTDGSWSDVVMERRLEEMEKRLRDHMDRRLDAIEHKLEVAVKNLLHNQTGPMSAAGEGADRTSDQKAEIPT
ncbi:ATPase PAAT [Synchiropus splendidus]|uniref:ATPase PAAT n=1 Tax=Synchiropus splendidus TaxID=270530 RepID=UPI00237E6B06|nr:ATPase PAAT [Synchiropus splendidus]